MAKKDPYNHKRTFLKWKNNVIKEGIPKISKTNSEIILQYILDMEKGLDVGVETIKGARGYPQLNSLRNRMIFFAKNFEEKFKISDIRKLTGEHFIRCEVKNQKIEIENILEDILFEELKHFIEDEVD